MTEQRELGRCGLHNLGNTCYANTIVQCLGHCISFRSFLLDKRYKVRVEGETLIDALEEVYRLIWKEGRTEPPRNLIRRMVTKLTNFIFVFEPNDISEFVGLLIDKVQQEICFPLLVNPLEGLTYRSSSYDSQRKKMDEAWIQAHKKEYSPLVDMMHGQLISQIVCGHCGKIHHNYEVFVNMFLPIEAPTLEGCLDHHFNDEMVNPEHATEKDDRWVCDGCKQSKPSVKTTKIWRLPKILILSLKRFNSQLMKVNQHVDIPLELDLGDHMLGPQMRKYELQAVGFHLGSFHGGHYIAACRLQKEDWVIKDDESVHTLPNSQFSDLGKGYVFFYEDLSSS